jgi:hypothetical protein
MDTLDTYGFIFVFHTAAPSQKRTQSSRVLRFVGGPYNAAHHPDAALPQEKKKTMSTLHDRARACDLANDAMRRYLSATYTSYDLPYAYACWMLADEHCDRHRRADGCPPPTAAELPQALATLRGLAGPTTAARIARWAWGMEK